MKSCHRRTYEYREIIQHVRRGSVPMSAGLGSFNPFLDPKWRKKPSHLHCWAPKGHCHSLSLRQNAKNECIDFSTRAVTSKRDREKPAHNTDAKRLGNSNHILLWVLSLGTYVRIKNGVAMQCNCMTNRPLILHLACALDSSRLNSAVFSGPGKQRTAWKHGVLGGENTTLVHLISACMFNKYSICKSNSKSFQIVQTRFSWFTIHAQRVVQLRLRFVAMFLTPPDHLQHYSFIDRDLSGSQKSRVQAIQQIWHFKLQKLVVCTHMLHVVFASSKTGLSENAIQNVRLNGPEMVASSKLVLFFLVILTSKARSIAQIGPKGCISSMKFVLILSLVLLLSSESSWTATCTSKLQQVIANSQPQQHTGYSMALRDSCTVSS